MEGFNWMIPHVLAGAARPGLMGSLDEDLTFLRQADIDMIVSLTWKPLELPPDRVFELLHFPILDMGVAPARSVADLCSKILGAIFDHRPVLLHCRAGLGRTGTIGACCLVSLGLTAEDAIRSLRTRSRLYIQTESQENMIGHYADHLHSLVDAGTLPDLFSPPGTLGLHSLSKRLAESGLSINGSRG